jgi:DNA-binding response OmpR family regulator
MRIVCVGTREPRRYLADALAESNHSVMELDNIGDAAYVASAGHVDAIIALTTGGALDAARSLAVRPAHTVLVVIDRHGDKDSRVAALQAGADICLDHPYEYAELHARLLAFCRQRDAGFTSNVKSVALPSPSAALTLSAATRSLVGRGGMRMLLRKREYLLMDRLLREPGVSVERDELVDYVFGEADADTTSLHLLVSRLRARLSRTNLPITLETVVRSGYRVIVATGQ